MAETFHSDPILEGSFDTVNVRARALWESMRDSRELSLHLVPLSLLRKIPNLRLDPCTRPWVS